MAMPTHRAVLSLPPAIRTAVFRSSAATFTSSPSTSTTLRTITTTTTPPHPTTTAPPNAHRSRPHSSVSPTEIAHFNALASSWWDPHGSSRLLHLMNPLRHAFIRQCLASHTRGPAADDKLRYLDIGCGGGIFAESAARMPHVASVTAIDPSPEVLAVAKRHQRRDPLLMQEGRLNYRNAAVEDLPLPTSRDGGYDILTLFEVLEHISQPAPFLRACLAHLRPGGWLVGSTIARSNTSWLTTKFVAEDVLGIVPRGTHDWNQYIDPAELRAWAAKQPELDVEMHGWRTMGVVYVPGVGWREVVGSEDWGNYFFGVRKRDDAS